MRSLRNLGFRESPHTVLRALESNAQERVHSYTLRVTAGFTPAARVVSCVAEHRASVRHPCAASKFMAVAAGAGLALAGSDRRTTAAC